MSSLMGKKLRILRGHAYLNPYNTILISLNGFIIEFLETSFTTKIDTTDFF